MDRIEREIVACRRCSRLVAWREQLDKRAAFRDETYWAAPVPGFGDPEARILVVGLAPAAHGANRTGRMFTGDRSGDFLYAGLHRAGLAERPESRHRGDGLRLHDVFITAAVRCAPPANRPNAAERDACAPFLERELELLGDVEAILALGRFAHEALCRLYGIRVPFAHGAHHELPDGRVMFDCYHVSQQNTFTGRLTVEMFDEVMSQMIRTNRSG